MKWNILLAVLLTLGTTTSLPPCADFVHSYCSDGFPIEEIGASNWEECHLACLFAGEKCKFSILTSPLISKNCRLYDESFSKFILDCNELAGPKKSVEGCDVLNPPENSCQIYRNGKCQFEDDPIKTYKLNSWENCQATCQFINECQFWRFEKEQKLCHILKSQEGSCFWMFSPRAPSFENCDDNPQTTSTSVSTTSTTINPTCYIPEAQEYGYWFCPPSTSANKATCHLECHPGYVSDDRTLISCQDGLWSSSPVCVEAIGLITGGDSLDITVEVYSKDKHQMLPNLPDGKSIHSVDFVNGYIILCGGQDTQFQPQSKCLELTPSLDWRSHSTTNLPRFGHSSVAILGKLHLLGGWNQLEEEPGRTTEHLSPATSHTWIIGHKLMETTWTLNACAAKINPEVFIVMDLMSVVSYNITSGAATRLKDMNIPRLWHGCVYLRDSHTDFQGILVAGGMDGFIWGNVLNESELFDLSTGQWSNVGPLPSPRSGVGLLKLGEEIFALGGYDGTIGTSITTVERFDITAKTWSRAEEMLMPRGGHTITAVPPNLVKFALNRN